MHFTIKDNFEDIIKSVLRRDKIKITKIPTGWTNYVFHAVISNRKSFIFRFPRNDFFAETLIKEERFTPYIGSKITFKVPEIRLFYDEKRPFTMHKYMSGKSLTECHKDLTARQKRRLCRDIAKFIKQVQSLNPPTSELTTLSAFLKGLSEVGSEAYDLRRHKHLVALEKRGMVLSHADFNPGNVLINSRNRMFAVLDFAFLSYTSDIIDLSRIIGRLPEDYYELMIGEYEKAMGKKVVRKDVEQLIKMWEYVEQKYIAYMKNNHPDVVLPD